MKRNNEELFFVSSKKTDSLFVFVVETKFLGILWFEYFTNGWFRSDYGIKEISIYVWVCRICRGGWEPGESARGYDEYHHSPGAGQWREVCRWRRGAWVSAPEDKSKVLVFNGEIYNYQELRRELVEAGHVFISNTDSETLLHGYEEWGEKLLDRLRGMYAFVIWDRKKKQLFAARDIFGIKPLYYAQMNRTAAFRSEISKGILIKNLFWNTRGLTRFLMRMPLEIISLSSLCQPTKPSLKACSACSPGITFCMRTGSWRSNVTSNLTLQGTVKNPSRKWWKRSRQSWRSLWKCTRSVM